MHSFITHFSFYVCLLSPNLNYRFYKAGDLLYLRASPAFYLSPCILSKHPIDIFWKINDNYAHYSGLKLVNSNPYGSGLAFNKEQSQ